MSELSPEAEASLEWQREREVWGKPVSFTVCDNMPRWGAVAYNEVAK